MTIVQIHLTIFLVTAVFILYSDHLAFQYLRGKLETVPTRRGRSLHYIVLAGLIGMILSGAYMAYPAWEYYIALPEFQLKMAFVGILVMNSFFISRFLLVARATPFRDVPKNEKLKFYASGVASAVGWVGAAVIGYFFL